jgi:hypothetical protein
MDSARAIKVSVSPKQMSRLRMGHPVRVKPPMEGSGIVVVVDPRKYEVASRSFLRNKGMQLQLSPEEIAINKQMEPEMQGQGIFGKTFDRAVAKVIGKKNRKVVYDAARELLPLAQSGLVGGLTSAGTALAVVQPELAPFIPAAVAGLSTLGSDYLSNPSAYQTKDKKKLGRTMAGKYARNVAIQSLNKELGTNMDNLTTAGIADAVANKASAELTKRQVEARQEEPVMGSGLYAGSGLYTSTSSGRGLYVSSRARGQGLYQRFVSHENPALRSQPYAENFAFKNTLPPQYQKYKI